MKWQEPGKERKVEEYERWTKKLNVWGGIGYYFKTDLYFLNKNMNSKLRLPPSYSAPDIPRTLEHKWVIVHDNHNIRKSVNSMPARLQQCLDRKGARTDY